MTKYEKQRLDDQHDELMLNCCGFLPLFALQRKSFRRTPWPWAIDFSGLDQCHARPLPQPPWCREFCPRTLKSNSDLKQSQSDLLKTMRNFVETCWTHLQIIPWVPSSFYFESSCSDTEHHGTSWYIIVHHVSRTHPHRSPPEDRRRRQQHLQLRFLRADLTISV